MSKKLQPLVLSIEGRNLQDLRRKFAALARTLGFSIHVPAARPKRRK